MLLAKPVCCQLILYALLLFARSAFVSQLLNLGVVDETEAAAEAAHMSGRSFTALLHR
jgi:hypothetical protein